MADRDAGDDGDGGDGGPDRGGRHVASLVPGPGARDRQGAGSMPREPLSRARSSRAPRWATLKPQAEGDQGAAEPGAQAEGNGANAGPPPEDSDQRDQGSWGWGWWGSNAWQSGSSHGAWWDRHRGDGDDGGAWARWNRGGRGAQPGSRSGYGGGGRRRPKPSEIAAALGRSLTREDWIEEFIADPPNPAHPSFATRVPGRSGCAAPSAPTSRSATPSTG